MLDEDLAPGAEEELELLSVLVEALEGFEALELLLELLVFVVEVDLAEDLLSVR